MKISSIVIQTRNLSTVFTRATMLLSLSASVLLLSCSLELVGSGLKSDNSVNDDNVDNIVQLSSLTLTYTSPKVAYVISNSTPAITPNLPIFNGNFNTFTVSPALPAGLVLDSVTGIISGTPTGPSQLYTDYIVSANTDEDPVSTKVTVAILNGFSVNLLTDLSDNTPGDGYCSVSGLTNDSDCSLRAAVEESVALGGNQAVILSSFTTYGLVSSINIDGTVNNLTTLTIQGQDRNYTIIEGSVDTRLFGLQGSGTKLYINNLKLRESGGVGSNQQGAINVSNAVGNPDLDVYRVVFYNNQNDSGVLGGGAISMNGDGALTVNECTFENNGSIKATVNGGAIAINGNVLTSIKNSNFLGNTTHSNRGGSAIAINIPGNDYQITNNFFQSNNTGFGTLYIQSGNGTIRNNSFYDNYSNTATSGGVITVAGAAQTVIANNTFISNRGNSAADGYALTFDGATVTNAQIQNNIFWNNIDNSSVLKTCKILNGATLINLGGNIFDDLTDDCTTLAGPNDQTVNAPPVLLAPAYNGGFVKTFALMLNSPAIDKGIDSNCSARDGRGKSRIDLVGVGSAICDAGAFEMQTNQAPSAIIYDRGLNLVLGLPMIPANAKVHGGAGHYFYSTQPLPNGLNLNASTGEITGTPTSTAMGMPRTIVVRNDAGEAQIEIWFDILPGYTVNLPNGDQNDANVGDGFCSISGALNNNDCTLRAAIQEADAINNRAVYIPSGMTVNVGNGGPYLVRNYILIKGAGKDESIIDAQATYRVFETFGGTSHLTIADLGIVNSFADSDVDGYGGSAIAHRDAGKVTVDNADISYNTVQGISPLGGAVLNEGGGTLQIFFTSFVYNQSTRGGAIGNTSSSTLRIYDSTFDKNGAQELGAAVFNHSGATYSYRSYYGQNVSIDSGGAIFSRGDTILHNNTFYKNEAAYGGAVYITSSYVDSYNNMFYQNSSGNAEGGAFQLDAGGSLYLANNVFFGHGTTCYDLVGDIFSQGGNISDGNDNCVRDSADIALYSDLVNEIESVPDLNGGFTKSLLLKSGSAALDFGLTVHCLDHDARGVKRILDADGDGAAFCDAGPIEHRPEDLN